MRVKDTTSIPLILVGNKCDMSSKREVEKSEGEAMAKTLGCEFLETSAKTCINVEQGTGQRMNRASAPWDDGRANMRYLLPRVTWPCATPQRSIRWFARSGEHGCRSRRRRAPRLRRSGDARCCNCAVGL